MKFDLPDPFGPISTFSGSSFNSCVFGPKESTSVSRMRWISMVRCLFCQSITMRTVFNRLQHALLGPPRLLSASDLDD